REIGDQQITPQRFAVLSIIGANPGLQQTQIAEIMGVARPGATSLIDFWETRGCVERRADPNDRRSYGIHVTPDGAGTLRSLQDKVKRHDDAIARCLSAEELDALMALLEKFYSAPPTK
ncbi:MAG: MarR family transcriptional regulator, partial [Caulobacterales bacterium]|nr:MarR family transcriptional regulator [Caulobacterales bacterium]